MSAQYETRPARLEDLSAVLELLNKESLRFSEEAEFSESDLTQEWTAPGFEPARDTQVVFRRDGTCLAYADYFNTREPYVRAYGSCSVDPDNLADFDWTYLQSWIEERAAHDLSRSSNELRFTLLAFTAFSNAKMLESWITRGFAESRRFYSMKIEFDGPPDRGCVADSYSVRPMRNDERRRVFDAVTEGFSDHYGFIVPSDPDKAYKRWLHYFFETDEYDPDMMLIAVTKNGEVAGASLSKPNHGKDADMGWVNSLAVRREHRRKGLGEALLRESFVVMQQKGKLRAGLGVDASSLTDATRLYEKCGMHAYRVFVQVQKILREGTEIANLGDPHHA